MTSPTLAPSGPQASRDRAKLARARLPRAALAAFDPSPDRDPTALLLGQSAQRIPELVPIRHGRMALSPLTFYRGAALPMAADLAAGPDTGLTVQLCGDAHLSNFGVFGTPERRVVFDVNDFDETLPGPFEWDVKRLAASLVLAARANGGSAAAQQTVARAALAGYRAAMTSFAGRTLLQVWYSRFDLEDTLARIRPTLSKRELRANEQQLARIRTRESTQALSKLTVLVDGRREFRADPPLIVPVEQLGPDYDAQVIYAEIRRLIDDYAATLPPERRHLVQRFQLTRLARKVVGVGSVGTQAWVLLMEPEDGSAPLLLQAKQAQRSVLAQYAGESVFDNQGERVVVGQRLMQAASDIFLGWQRVSVPGRTPTDYYVRQLRDWKYSVDVDAMDAKALTAYASACGWTLARAHARTGDRIAIAAYLGGSDRFERAMLDFALAYADQTERDHAAFVAAVRSGAVPALEGR